MPEPTRLQLALADACDIARTEGVEDIGPDDFGLQRSEAGWQHATYVGADRVVSVTIDPDDAVSIAVGEIDWISTKYDAVCPNCEGDASVCECEPGEPLDQWRGRICTVVPLPGDGAPPPALELPPYAVRDAHGCIRRQRDGLFIAGPEATAATVAARIAAYNGDHSARANTMRQLYRAALEVIAAEAAEAVSA